MRRTTLGPISAADLNSSLDDSRLSLGVGRKSLSTSQSGRHSLLKTTGAPGTAKKAAPSSRLSIVPGGAPSDVR
jgi:hypothetical protein